MVDMIFKDPALKGKRPAQKRKVLPFAFKGTVEAPEEPASQTPENTAEDLPQTPAPEQEEEMEDDDQPITVN